jgi:hypothetical protein
MAVGSLMEKMPLRNSVEYIHGSVTFTTDMTVMALHSSIHCDIVYGVTDALLSNLKSLRFWRLKLTVI